VVTITTRSPSSNGTLRRFTRRSQTRDPPRETEIGAFAGIDGVSDAWDTRFQKAVNAAQSTKVS